MKVLHIVGFDVAEQMGKETISFLQEKELRFAIIGRTLFVEYGSTVETYFESSQHVLNISDKGNGGLYAFLNDICIDKENFQQVMIQIAKEREEELLYTDPQIICIEYLTNAHFNSGNEFMDAGRVAEELREKICKAMNKSVISAIQVKREWKMDDPDKYFCNVNDDLEELAENLGWIKYRKEGMKVWFDEILLLVEVASMPSAEPVFVKDDFYTVEQWQELQVRNDLYEQEGNIPDLYKVVGWVETEADAIEWMNS